MTDMSKKILLIKICLSTISHAAYFIYEIYYK